MVHKINQDEAKMLADTVQSCGHSSAPRAQLTVKQTLSASPPFHREGRLLSDIFWLLKSRYERQYVVKVKWHNSNIRKTGDTCV